MMIIIWILIAYFVYQYAKNRNIDVFSNKKDIVVKEDSAEKILKIRYANGEIDDETYMTMLKNISQK